MSTQLAVHFDYTQRELQSSTKASRTLPGRLTVGRGTLDPAI